MRPWQALSCRCSPCANCTVSTLPGKRCDTCNGPYIVHPLPFRQSPRLKGMQHCPKADRPQNLLFWPFHTPPALCAPPALNAKCPVDTTLIIRLLQQLLQEAKWLSRQGDSPRGQPASTKRLLVNESRSSSVPPCCIFRCNIRTTHRHNLSYPDASVKCSPHLQ